MAEDIPSSNGMFALEDEFRSMENDFGEMIEDIEIPRRSVTFADESHQSDRSHLQLPTADDRTDISLDSHLGAQQRHSLEEGGHGLNDFGGPDLLGDGFGLEDGGFPVNLPNVPGLDDINLEGSNMETEQPAPAETAPDQRNNETAMEVDQVAHDETLRSEPEGFSLEPVDPTGTKRRPKKKRKLLVDTDTELTSQTIRANLSDPSDTLQPKCFPPPTKKALLWKEAASCEQLFIRPTLPFMVSDVASMITRNFAHCAPAPANKSLLDLEQDVEVMRGPETDTSTVADTSIRGPLAAEPLDPLSPKLDGDHTLIEDEQRPDDMLNMDMGGDLLNMEEGLASRIIPELPDLEGTDGVPATQSTEDQQSGEASEEYERRRWTKRTQQVLRMVERGLSQQKVINFKSLTRKCSRKHAAARFYTCLLLTKEGAIEVQQEEAYGDIAIQRGPRYAEAF